MVVPIGVPSMRQIHPFKNDLYSIGGLNINQKDPFHMPHDFLEWHTRMYTCFLKWTEHRYFLSRSATEVSWVACPLAMHRREVWPWGFAWASGKLYKPRKISTLMRYEQTKKKTVWRAIRCYATLGTGDAPDCPGLRGWEKCGLLRSE